MKKTIGIGRFSAYLLAFGLSVLLVFVSVYDVLAAPANPFAFDDEDDIILFFRGDEFFSWVECEDGFVVAFDEQSGYWRYAVVTGGVVVPSGQIVGSFDAALVNATADGGIGAGVDRMERSALMPLIQNAWRFDPGNPALEFQNGQVVADHRLAIPSTTQIVPVVTPPSALQPGQPMTPPTIPNFTSITLPPSADPGTPAVRPPTPPTPPPGGGGGGGGGPATIGGGNPIFTPPSLNASFAAAATVAAMSHIQTNQRLLVLLLEFDNMPMLNNSAFYHNKYFNTSPGAISVANYFRDMSGGRDIFVPAGNVTADGTFRASLPSGDGPAWATSGVNVTVTPSTHNGIVNVHIHMNHPITAWSAPAGHEAARAAVSVALAAIHQNSNFNFNGVHVAAVFAGGEAADNYNPGGQVWAHAWQFRGSTVGQQGWPRYMAYGERQRRGQIMGIGLAVHELGHVLGLPDLYDITGMSEGVGPYSVMALGSWGRGANDAAAGHRPTALDAWSRIQLGYIQPTIVSSGTWRGSVNSINVAGSNVIMVTSPANNSQYFLIENRQFACTWDAGLQQWIRNPDAPGGIMILHADDSRRSSNTADMNMNNNNRNHLMVSVIEADGTNLLLNSVARWAPNQDHFFSASPFNSLGASTNPNSNFHGGGGRNTATGIDITVLSPRGNSMEVEIVLERSGGATGPQIGAGGGAGSAAPAQGGAAAPAATATVATTTDTAALNHARIQNQIFLGASIPTLAVPMGTDEVLVYGATLQALISGGHDLAVAGARNIILPPALLSEMLAGGNANSVFAIRITSVGSGANIDISVDGRPLLVRSL